VNYAISLSSLSGAEIVLLRVIEKTDELKDISVDVENTSDTHDSLKRNVHGPFVSRNGRHNKEM